jgi:hypothetical protein
MAFLLPHEFFHYLFTKRNALFQSMMLGGSSDNLPKFWQGVMQRKDPRFQQLLDNSEITQNPQWMHWYVPLSVHGDAVPVIAVGKPGTKSLDVTSFQSLLAAAWSSLNVKVPICSCFEQSKVEDITSKEMDKVISWSLDSLQEGKWPRRDHNGVDYAPGTAEAIMAGEDLAGGFAGVVYLSKSDLDHLAKALGLRHYGANEPCELCPCNKQGDSSLWPSNFGPDSAWIDKLCTPEEWRVLRPRPDHWLFKLKHITQCNIEPDELHCIWLGTAMYMNGSALWLLVFRAMPGNPSENMQQLWQEISMAYSESDISTQFTNLSIGSFCDAENPRKHFPKLKGKGAEVKGLSTVLCKVWDRHMDPSNEEHKLVAAALAEQLSFLTIIDDHAAEIFLPADQAAKLQKHIMTFLERYTELGHIADAHGDLLWNMVPKFHWLYHLSERAFF